MKNEQHQTPKDYLQSLSHPQNAAFLEELSEEHVSKLQHFVSDVLSRESESYDQLFESLAMMMRYVPNFILHSMIPKYIHPVIAAKISAKLTVKQVIGVTGGLSAEYISDAAIHMESKTAAEVLAGLKRKLASEVIALAVKKHPMPALDIIDHAAPAIQKQAADHYRQHSFNLSELSVARQSIFQALQTYL